MALEIRPYREEDLAGMIKVWNEVVEAGEAFPQIEPLTMDTARAFFAEQTLTTVAAIDDKLFGLYILHPNNVGRCVHVANASYAVASSARGLGLGRELVKDSLAQAARKASAACSSTSWSPRTRPPSTCTRTSASRAWAPSPAVSATSWAATRTCTSTTRAAWTGGAPAEASAQARSRGFRGRGAIRRIFESLRSCDEEKGCVFKQATGMRSGMSADEGQE